MLEVATSWRWSRLSSLGVLWLQTLWWKGFLLSRWGFPNIGVAPNHAIGVPPIFSYCGTPPLLGKPQIAMDNSASVMLSALLCITSLPTITSIHLFGQIPGDLCMISFWCGKTLGLNLDMLPQRIGFPVGMDNTLDFHKSTYIPTNTSQFLDRVGVLTELQADFRDGKRTRFTADAPPESSLCRRPSLTT